MFWVALSETKHNFGYILGKLAKLDQNQQNSKNEVAPP